ncbi:MAG: dihydrofolate reductase [Paenibacillaceae bacterium]|nr:dihydrofolate reductase [Paenibacillaceae bacterium]
MRKLIVQEMVTIDGFFAGRGGDISWHRVDDEYEAYAIASLRTVDCLLFGKATYQLMASYWPTADGEIAGIMNTIPKIVVSTTLQTAEWRNSKLMNGEIVESIARLKRLPGKNIAILGSATLASSLLHAGLIDEYQLTVVPIVLGEGSPLFLNVPRPFNMKLVKSNLLKSGCAQLYYQPEKAE